MDKPFNEYKFFKDYQIYCSYHTNKYDGPINEDNPIYIKMTIYYKEVEIYKNNLYGDDIDRTEEIYNEQCLSHQRQIKLKQLGL